MDESLKRTKEKLARRGLPEI